MKIKKWISSLILPLVIFLYFFCEQYVMSFPYIYELIFALILWFGVVFVKETISHRQLSKSGQRIAIKHDLDNLNRFALIIFGIAIIAFKFTDFEESSWLQSINWILLGLYQIALAFIYPKSIILDRSNEAVINAIGTKFKITTTDKALFFTPSTMSVTYDNDKINKLYSLDLKKSDPQSIANWVSAKLPNSSIRYFMKKDTGELEEIFVPKMN